MGYLIFIAVMLTSTTAGATPPVGVAVAAVLTSAGVGAATAVAIGKFVVSTLITSALSFARSALTRRPDSQAGSFASLRTNGSTQQFRQPVTERKIVYGEVRTSGAILYAGVTDDNRYLHMVIEMASHEVEDIGEIYINSDSVPPDALDADGMMTTGRYADHIRFRKHLGSDDQLADPDLIAGVPEWTDAHRLRGIAYIYVRMEWNRDIYVSGIPNISAWVRGKKCLDPRDDVEKYTANIALQSNDYLTNDFYGLNAENVNQDEVIGAANTCDEIVEVTNVDYPFDAVVASTDLITMDSFTLELQTGDVVQLTSGVVGGLVTGVDYYVITYQHRENPRIRLAASLEDAFANIYVDLTSGDSGILTKVAEPRYHGGGVLQMSAPRGQNLQDILSGMDGVAVHAGGAWRLLAGEYQIPTLGFNEGDLVGSIKIDTKVSGRDRFNRVQGIFISPMNNGNPSDYPVVKNDFYQLQDGKEIQKTLDLAFTQRSSTAQRIAKLRMERTRQEITFTASMNLKAFKLKVGDNFFMSFDKYGWNNKIFEVINWSLVSQEGAATVEMVCRENAAEVYDWNAGEETMVDLAPNTSLPNPFDVAPPTGLATRPIEIQTAAGDFVYEFELSWTPPNDLFVTNGGHYKVQFKRSVDEDWSTSFRAEDDDVNILVKQVQPATNYDVRIQAVNYLGARSQFQQLLGFSTDSPSGATITFDYGQIDGMVSEDRDYEFIDQAIVGEQDFGGI